MASGCGIGVSKAAGIGNQAGIKAVCDFRQQWDIQLPDNQENQFCGSCCARVQKDPLGKMRIGRMMIDCQIHLSQIGARASPKSCSSAISTETMVFGRKSPSKPSAIFSIFLGMGSLTRIRALFPICRKGTAKAACRCRWYRRPDFGGKGSKYLPLFAKKLRFLYS